MLSNCYAGKISVIGILLMPFIMLPPSKCYLQNAEMCFLLCCKIAACVMVCFVNFPQSVPRP